MLCNILCAEAGESTLKQIKLREGKRKYNASGQKTHYGNHKKIVKPRTGKVKIIFRARKMVDNCAVISEPTLVSLPPRQKEGNITPYPTPASEFEPSV